MIQDRSSSDSTELLPLEERALFHQATADVIRIQSSSVPQPSIKAIVKPKDRQHLPSLSYDPKTLTADLQAVSGEEFVLFQRPGIQPRQLLQLKKGKLQPEAVLDLHGLKQLQAELQLRTFLHQSWQLDLRTLLIIHGKGHGSPDGTAVLKSWLVGELPKYQEVLAFCSAQPRDGGTGALYLQLKQKRPTL